MIDIHLLRAIYLVGICFGFPWNFVFVPWRAECEALTHNDFMGGPFLEVAQKRIGHGTIWNPPASPPVEELDQLFSNRVIRYLDRGKNVTNPVVVRTVIWSEAMQN